MFILVFLLMKIILFATVSFLTAFLGVFVKINNKEFNTLANISLLVSVATFYYAIYLFLKYVNSKKRA